MHRKDSNRPYREFNNVNDGDEEGKTRSLSVYEAITGDQEEPDGSVAQEDDIKDSKDSTIKLNKTCLKNVFTVVLILIYLLLTAIAAFLAYQTISDFKEKLNNPVMSVTYKKAWAFQYPGIALYPGKAALLDCKIYKHGYIPPAVHRGEHEERRCGISRVTYPGPFTNNTTKTALVVRGPSDVREKELVFMKFSLTETEEDFSAISYLLFYSFSEYSASSNRQQFMMDCEKNYSMWTFSGGFRTWVKMSLVRTYGEHDNTVEFHQESAVVKFNDRRPAPERRNTLFFVVFEWRDPYIQEIRLIVTANPWNAIAILCGVFMALFKAANFAKLSVTWIIRMRKQHLRNKTKELSHVAAEK